MKPIALRLLKEQTEVAEQSPVMIAKASIRAWGKVTPIYLNGEVVGFFNDSLEDDHVYEPDSLPIEFFNHEIMDYGAKDEIEDAKRIVECFGVPYGINDKQTKNFYRSLFLGQIELPPQAAKTVEEARQKYIARSHENNVVQDMSKEAFEEYLLLDWKMYDLREYLEDYVCTLNEVSGALKSLRYDFLAVMAFIDSRGVFAGSPVKKRFYDGVQVSEDDLEKAIREINQSAYTSLALTYDEKVSGYLLGFSFGGDNLFRNALTSAAAMQFIEAVNDATPWRRCKKCGRLFKYQINERRRQAAKKVNGGKGHEDAAYCCKKCADAGRQSAYRAGIRAKSGV